MKEMILCWCFVGFIDKIRAVLEKPCFSFKHFLKSDENSTKNYKNKRLFFLIFPSAPTKKILEEEEEERSNRKQQEKKKKKKKTEKYNINMKVYIHFFY